MRVRSLGRRGRVLVVLAALAGAVACSDRGAESPMARNDASNAAPGTTVTTAAVAPATTTEVDLTRVGTEQVTPVGNRVTVFEVDLPAEPDAPLDEEALAQLEDDARVAAVDGQFCAAAGEDVRALSAGDFFLVTADERLLSYWDEPVNSPRFPLSHTADAGECVRGWVAFIVPEDDDVVAVRWDVNGTGGGPFLEWNAGS